MKQELNEPHHVHLFHCRGYLLLLSITACLLGSCGTMWNQVDPEYVALQAEVRTDWAEDDIVGVWVAQTSPRPGLPALRVTIVIKPDHTAEQRQVNRRVEIYVEVENQDELIDLEEQFGR